MAGVSYKIHGISSKQHNNVFRNSRPIDQEFKWNPVVYQASNISLIWGPTLKYLQQKLF